MKQLKVVLPIYLFALPRYRALFLYDLEKMDIFFHRYVYIYNIYVYIYIYMYIYIF